ncbi:MAG TPA: hypothetical protein DCR55_14715, partial [Lentisphaeria bacterium]|nr:hypothetical protein [Lentisphaeria bacterium]
REEHTGRRAILDAEKSKSGNITGIRLSDDVFDTSSTRQDQIAPDFARAAIDVERAYEEKQQANTRTEQTMHFEGNGFSAFERELIDHYKAEIRRLRERR